MRELIDRIPLPVAAAILVLGVIAAMTVTETVGAVAAAGRSVGRSAGVTLSPASFSPADDRELMLEADYDVGPGGELVVEVGDADVNLRTVEGDGVRIEVWLEADDMDRARERYEKMNFTASSSGDRIVLETDEQESGFWNWSWGDWGDFSIEVEVTLPEEFDVNLSTGDGDVSVERVRGELEISTGDGDVGVEAMSSGSVDISTGDGDVWLGTVSATDIDLSTGDGDVLIETATTPGGIDLSTGDGDVVVRGLSGPLSASTGDGDVAITIVEFGETGLTTGDGDVTIRAPAGLSATLDLSGGEVSMGRQGVEFKGTFDDDMARGDLNGGGPRLYVRTGDDDIVLRIGG